MTRLREYRPQVRRLENMVRDVRQDRTQTDQDGHRTTSVRTVCVKQTVQQLHRDYRNVAKYPACFLTHPQDQVTCMECNPYSILL